MLKHLGRQTVRRSALSRVSKQVVRSKSVAVDDLADRCAEVLDPFRFDAVPPN